ncbi:hypothetical protein ACFPN2_24560 [Steroidobacter flavus]|uniref:Uncharacterized protein n=1 Tax=Steroidobacter flavus TaxID=1842136 RepID=A0ABV8SXQ8_9GAMM
MIRTHRKSEKTLSRVTAVVLALTALTPLAAVAHKDSDPVDLAKDIDKGPVWRTWTARVAEDKMDDYLNYLTKVYKHNLAAWKAAGLITDYKILIIEPRGADDPNILMMYQYRNMAALDAPEELWTQASKQALDKIQDPEVRKLIGADYDEWRTYTGWAPTAREVKL